MITTCHLKLIGSFKFKHVQWLNVSAGQWDAQKFFACIDRMELVSNRRHFHIIFCGSGSIMFHQQPRMKARHWKIQMALIFLELNLRNIKRNFIYFVTSVFVHMANPYIQTRYDVITTHAAINTTHQCNSELYHVIICHILLYGIIIFLTGPSMNGSPQLTWHSRVPLTPVWMSVQEEIRAQGHITLANIWRNSIIVFSVYILKHRYASITCNYLYRYKLSTSAGVGGIFYTNCYTCMNS